MDLLPASFVPRFYSAFCAGKFPQQMNFYNITYLTVIIDKACRSGRLSPHNGATILT